MSRSSTFAWSICLCAVASVVHAQQVIYTNDDASGAPNTVSAYVVGANGSLTPMIGSPFRTGGNGGVSGTFGSQRLILDAGRRLLYVTNDGSHTISVLSLDANGLPTPIAGSPFFVSPAASNTSLALSADGRFLFVGSNEGTFDRRVYTLRLSASGIPTVTGSVLVASAGPSTLIAGMKVTPDGRFLALATLSGGISMLSIGPTGSLAPVAGSPFRGSGFGVPATVEINAAGTRLFSAEGSAGPAIVNVFDITASGVLVPVTGSPFRVLDFGSDCTATLLSKDERLLFVTHQAGYVSVLSVAPGGSLTPVPGSPFVNFSGQPAAVAAVGPFLYTAAFSFPAGFINGYRVDATGALAQISTLPIRGTEPATLLSIVALDVTNRPPVANAGTAQIAEATGPYGAAFTLDGTASSDPDRDTLRYTWTAPFLPTPATGPAPTIVVPAPSAPARSVTYNVTLTVDDGHGATDTAPVALTVTDTTPPLVHGVPQPSVVEAGSPVGTFVLYGRLTADDLVDGARPVDCVPVAGALFPLGTTTVSCAAADLRANTLTTTFDVTVRDTLPPAIAVTSPAATMYTQGQTVTAAFSCIDSASAVVECSAISSGASAAISNGGALDTGTAGDFIFTVTAVDSAGNRSTRTIPYTVAKTIDLLVTDAHGQRVLAYDTGTLAFAGTFIPASAGPGAVGCAVVHERYLFVCGVNTNTILRYDATTGTAAPSPGNAGAVFAAGVADFGAGAGPTALRFGPDGLLYVTSNLGGVVERYDGATGRPLPAAGRSGAVIADTPQNSGLDFGPDGFLYVAVVTPASVWRIDPITGVVIDQYIPPAALAGGRLTSLLWGPDGNLYLGGTDDSSPGGIIRRYAGNGRPLPVSGRPDALVAAFDQPVRAMAFGPDRGLYVGTSTDAGDHDLLQLDPNSGAVIGHLALPRVSSPAGIAFSHDVTTVKTAPVVSVSGGSFAYDGLPHPAACSAAGIFGEDLGPLTVTYRTGAQIPRDAGRYAVECAFDGSEWYSAATATSVVVVEKATPSVIVTGGTFVYDAQPHIAAGLVTGVGGIALGVPLFLYDGGAVPPTAAGVHTVVGSFAGDINYLPATSAPATLTINAPPAITSFAGPPQPVTPGVLVTLTATFEDAATNDAHECTFAWGDATPDAAQRAAETGSGACAALHAYAAAGLYPVTVSVVDDDGLQASATFTVVVYDPAAGIVTGAGLVASPAGAYAAHPAAGTASFTIAAGYLRNATAPTGITLFNYSAAALNFVGGAYQWLVVSGNRAWWRGTGVVTINGVSQPADFLLAVVDGAGAAADRLRIKIWNPGGTIYDGQPGAPDAAPAAPLVSAGPLAIVAR